MDRVLAAGVRALESSHYLSSRASTSRNPAQDWPLDLGRGASRTRAQFLLSRGLYRGRQDMEPLLARAISTPGSSPCTSSLCQVGSPDRQAVVIAWSLCALLARGPLGACPLPTRPSGLRLASCLSISGPLQVPATRPVLSKGVCGPETGQSPPGTPFKLCRSDSKQRPVVCLYVGV